MQLAVDVLKPQLGRMCLKLSEANQHPAANNDEDVVVGMPMMEDFLHPFVRSLFAKAVTAGSARCMHPAFLGSGQCHSDSDRVEICA